LFGQDFVEFASQIVLDRRIRGDALNRVLELAPVVAEFEGGQRVHRVPGLGDGHGLGGPG
jgi:hypothetical protein